MVQNIEATLNDSPVFVIPQLQIWHFCIVIFVIEFVPP